MSTKSVKATIVALIASLIMGGCINNGTVTLPNPGKEPTSNPGTNLFCQILGFCN